MERIRWVVAAFDLRRCVRADSELLGAEEPDRKVFFEGVVQHFEQIRSVCTQFIPMLLLIEDLAFKRLPRGVEGEVLLVGERLDACEEEFFTDVLNDSVLSSDGYQFYTGACSSRTLRSDSKPEPAYTDLETALRSHYMILVFRHGS